MMSRTGDGKEGKQWGMGNVLAAKRERESRRLVNVG